MQKVLHSFLFFGIIFLCDRMVRMKKNDRKKYGLIIMILLLLLGGIFHLYKEGYFDFKVPSYNIVLVKGEVFKLKNDEYGNKIVWESADKDVAIINENGEIVSLSIGNTTITIKENKRKKAIYNVGVVNPSNDVEVNKVSLNKTSGTIKVGEILKLTATVSPDNASNKNITWISSNNDVATVNDIGEVLAKMKGNVNIIAKANNVLVAICEIMVGE